MYSNKPNVNILTALLVAHGIRHAVVCPGSRNAPIVHNLNEVAAITCHPVTDERSAGFYALGMALALDEPVAVCVTSGSALLALLPAVAEACHQHHSLVVISADRPERWIGQLDGQTLRQPGALGPWVSRSVTLPEDDAWLCNRLVNEALLDATEQDDHPCVHINVPISEPLFHFTVEQLPAERVISRFRPAADYDCLPQQLVDDLLAARRPVIVFGQLSPRRFHYEAVDYLFSHVVVLHEALAPLTSLSHFDTAQARGLCDGLQPDFILYVGGAVVSKRLKHFLRQATGARCWRVSPGTAVEDTFQNLTGLVVGDAELVLQSLNRKMAHFAHGPAVGERAAYRRQWLAALSAAARLDEAPRTDFSAHTAVALLEARLPADDTDCHVHYANSTAVRLANIFAHRPVWCNRGVNGIEGSLSTAAGFSLVVRGLVVCVIGDLSFFYDQNALWPAQLRGNLRILLLNNGGGAIFGALPGLDQSPAAATLVAAAHRTTARGVCQAYGVDHIEARTAAELAPAVDSLLSRQAERPVLLEVILTKESS